MKPNFVSAERTFSRRLITKQNEQIDRLSAKILPHATILFEQAIQRHTATASADVLIGEARAVLDEMLHELSDDRWADEQSHLLRDALAYSLNQAPSASADQQWILSRGRDLARAVATYWFGLEPGQRAELLQATTDWSHHAALADFRLIAVRFYLEEEAGTLLELLQEEALHHYEVVMIVHPDQSHLVSAMIEQYKDHIIDNGGKIHRIEDWGRRSLAYAIRDLKDAHYLCINVECGAGVLRELNSMLLANAAILRSLTVRINRVETKPSPMMTSISRSDTKLPSQQQNTSARTVLG